MKKHITALLLGAALIPAAVIASGKYGHEHRLERMTEDLQLNAAQQAQLKDIFEAQKEKRRAIREETRQQINAILTEEQRTNLEKHREERRKRMCERKGEHHGEHHGEERHADS